MELDLCWHLYLEAKRGPERELLENPWKLRDLLLSDLCFMGSRLMAGGPIPPSVPSHREFKSTLAAILLPLTNHHWRYVQLREAGQSA